MSGVTHDSRAWRHQRAGLALALTSALTFGLSGALARPLLDSGWTAGSVVLLRIALGAVVLLPFGLRALDRRWHLLRLNAGLIGAYGVFAVAGAQFGYFSAVRTMDVGAALLIEYTAPAAVVAWMWVVHRQRPHPATLAGLALAAVGLVLVLDLFSGTRFNLAGTLWALGAMVGASVYFVLGGRNDTDLPPLTLAASGLVVGGAALGTLALTGLLPMQARATPVTYGGTTVSPWVAILALGTVTAALAYATGVAAVRRLGPRLASFVALAEVVLAIGWAWLLLDQLPGLLPLAGGALILAGVVGVQRGEARMPHPDPIDSPGPTAAHGPTA